MERDDVELDAGDEDARAAAVLGEVLGEAQRGGARGAAAEVEHGAAHGGAEAEERGEAVVRARGLRARVGGHDEVGDVGRGAAPPDDGPLRRLRRELRPRGGGDVQPGVQRRRGAVEELRVRGNHLLVVVEETLVGA
ncbi:Os07g0525450 [Oryza sativa Japonica Group]|uniref:Os07g0525450 protein n=1 Tax=Oryza sativa subsp. japonica TaxID=39947 RepID=A0A0P0X7A1_ORYSJ|nr:hypothetical protein EE612_039659 [Oryza sativa]BAT01847.1 Os07g0525450 [Oryza sativa Japonica Group]